MGREPSEFQALTAEVHIVKPGLLSSLREVFGASKGEGALLGMQKVDFVKDISQKSL